MLVHGDCLEELKKIEANSVDSLVTDPPAGIAFMNKGWDGNKGGRDQWIAWLRDVMTEVYRVLKPGASGVVWSLPRTSHWTATALEDAGFEIRDCIYHLFGSGFPKNHDISKAIDKAQGAERKIIAFSERKAMKDNKVYRKFGNEGYLPITEPTTEDAKQWEGWGTALKPAAECWWLIRKPIAEASVAQNVLAHGTGAINIDASRIDLQGDDTSRGVRPGKQSTFNKSKVSGTMNDDWRKGRWPSHLLLTHSIFCTQDECTQDCPIAKINTQSADQPARYFAQFSPDEPQFLYASKTSTRERNAGCEALQPHTAQVGFVASEDTPRQNSHPTVKSQKLMSYLVRLVTPPGGTVLDPFGGSGSTALACIAGGFDYILIEREAEYIDIAQARINHALGITQLQASGEEPQRKAA